MRPKRAAEPVFYGVSTFIQFGDKETARLDAIPHIFNTSLFIWQGRIHMLKGPYYLAVMAMMRAKARVSRKKLKGLILKVLWLDNGLFLIVSALFKGQLRIQKEALGWFVFLKQFSFGGMLADDMGLGKTIDVFAMLAGEDRSGPPSLIVTSTSLVLIGRGRPGVLSLI